MSPDLALPWRTLDVHLVPWRAVLRHDGHEAPISATELLDACAAVELGREPGRIVRTAIARRARGSRAALPWLDLAAGAHGLRRGDADGVMTLGACLDAMGVELVAFEYAASRDERRAA